VKSIYITRDETSTSGCLVAIGAVIHPIRCPLGLEAIAIGRLVAARMLLAGARRGVSWLIADLITSIAA
jgi:hypothetical protein